MTRNPALPIVTFIVLLICSAVFTPYLVGVGLCVVVSSALALELVKYEMDLGTQDLLTACLGATLALMVFGMTRDAAAGSLVLAGPLSAACTRRAAVLRYELDVMTGAAVECGENLGLLASCARVLSMFAPETCLASLRPYRRAIGGRWVKVWSLAHPGSVAHWQRASQSIPYPHQVLAREDWT